MIESSKSAATGYERLTALLETQNAQYRTIDHEPEGATELVSRLRAHPPAQAAKCIIVMVKLGRKTTQYVLAVVPGDRLVDLNSIKAYLDGTYVSFASQAVAEELAGSVSGTILPFSFDDRLKVIADPSIFENENMYFNAARLDRSIEMKTADYRRIAQPVVRPITKA